MTEVVQRLSGPVGRMVPFTGIWFPDSQLESQFANHRTLKHFVRVDAIFMYLNILIHAVHVSQEVVAHGRRWTVLPAVGLATFVFVYYLAAARLRVHQNVRRRVVLTLVLRVVLCPIIPSIMFTSWFSFPVVDGGSFVKFVVFSSGLMPLIVMPLGVQHLMKYHLPIQFISTAMVALSAGPRACSMAVSSPEGVQYVQATWRILNSLFVWEAGGLFNTKKASTGLPIAACVHMMNWFYAFWGFCIPSYTLWLLEYHSRVHFIEHRAAHRPVAMLQWNKNKLNNWVVTAHVFTFVILGANYWLWSHPSRTSGL